MFRGGGGGGGGGGGVKIPGPIFVGWRDIPESLFGESWRSLGPCAEKMRHQV